MGKLIFLALLLVLLTARVTAQVLINPVADKNSVDAVSSAGSEDKDSSSSSSSSSSESSSEDDDDDDESVGLFEVMQDKERMLCNVIVRATHDLRIHESKSADEIVSYLKEDCKRLDNEELVEECREMVSQHGAKIYAHVGNGAEMSEICKTIEGENGVDLDDEGTVQCAQDGKDKCQCCKTHVEKRKLRMRFIVKQMAKKRLAACKRSPRPQRCRRYIQRRTMEALKKIRKICPYMVCKHLGYCGNDVKNGPVNIVPLMQPKTAMMLGYPSLTVGLLDQQLEAHLTQNVCSEFEQLQPLCVHVAASVDSRRYSKLYMAVLDNDPKWIAEDIRKEVQSAHAGANANLCDTCKNVVQSSKTFFLQALDSVRSALDSICEKCPAKDKCKAFFKGQLDTVATYVNQLKPDEFCSQAGLCSPASSSPSTAISVKTVEENCGTCVQYLQPRKTAAIQAVNRLSLYFTARCAVWDMPNCQQFFSEVISHVSSYINELDVQGVCQAMGFCGKNAAQDLVVYEQAFVDEMNKNVCPTLGPFEALCRHVVQGNLKLVQAVAINPMSIDEFFQSCEEENTGAAPPSPDACTNGNDKCKCCIARVQKKKQCWKKRVAKYVQHHLELCKRCPAQDKCVHYWEEKKACWDAKIDKICPMKACTRMGYCKKPETSSMCAYMGPFKQICEQTLANAGQLLEAGREQTAKGVANLVSLSSKNEKEQQPAANKNP